MRSPQLLAIGMPLALAVVVAVGCSSDTTGIQCDPATVTPLALGVTVNGSLDTGNCISEGDPGDAYSFTLTGTTTARFTATSDKFQPEIGVGRLNATSATDAEVMQVFGQSGQPTRGWVILPAGSYAVDLQSNNDAFGAYTLNTATGDPTGCVETNGGMAVFAIPSGTINGSWDNTDCFLTGGLNEGYAMRLIAGRAYTFTLRSSIQTLGIHLEVSKDGQIVAGNGTNSNTGVVTFSYTPTSTGYYRVGTAPIGAGRGPYTLTVS
jgi:hypothetical protein